MQIKKRKIAVFLILCLGFFIFPKTIIIADNDQPTNLIYSINLDKATIGRGYTVDGFNGDIKLSLVPGILSQDTPVEVIQLNEDMPSPLKLDRISHIYQFEFKNKAAYDVHKPFYIQFSYSESNNFDKQVYFFDKNYNSWRPLPTRDFPDKFFVRSLIHLPFARIAIFSNPDLLTAGEASWYSYRGGNFAASPDFPQGSRLRVHIMEENGSKQDFIDVIINDFGPDREKHPGRVLDIDRVAFEKIANPGDGVTSVYIEPLYVAPEGGKVLSATAEQEKLIPRITAKSAIALDSNTGDVIFEKDADKALPLASLTKLMSMKILLDNGIDLKSTVAYSAKDEEYNYLYCDKTESARLRVSDGETMTVKDLLYASLVGSANNAVETLVRASGLGRDEFIRRMNNEAGKLGADSTFFEEPTGLSPKNVSTARDYAIITAAALKNPTIQNATVSKDYSFSTINTKQYHYIKNTSRLLRAGILNITGSKTGFLDEAKYCLMTRARSGEKEVTVVLFGAESLDSRDYETASLANYGFKIIDYLN